jgi:hypothetical protein
MDGVLAIFPWFLLLPMRGIKWVEKIGVGFAMSLGILCVIKSLSCVFSPWHHVLAC